MTSKKFLEDQDDDDLSATCLTRLKISGSTYIELTALKDHFGPFIVLVKHNEKIQQAVVVENLREDLPATELRTKVRLIPEDKIPANLH